MQIVAAAEYWHSFCRFVCLQTPSRRLANSKPGTDSTPHHKCASTHDPGSDAAASRLRRVIEVFGTERASEDFVFNNQSLPFLQQVTKSGATYKFIQGVIYTPQETTPIPFVSPTGFLNADLSPFVAHIQTQV